MPRDRWNELVAQARAVDMIGVAHRYGADLRRQGRELVGPCPACGTGRDRFSINPENSLFNCRICRRGGRGAIDLELFLGGGDFVDAVKRLVGLRAPSGQPRSPVDEAVPGAQAKKRMQVQAQSTAKQERIARWLWANREPAEGSVVETYLRARGYDGSIPKTIGFLSPRKEHASAMVSVYGLPIEFDGELEAPRHTDIKGVHLTKLLPDGSDRRRDRNANGIAKTKITVGSPLGTPIAISSIMDGLSLAVVEGVEDALAYRAAGYSAWAAGSSAYLPALAASIPEYITTVIIEVHPDESQAAQNAAARLQARLRERPVRPGERPIEIILRWAVS